MIGYRKRWLCPSCPHRSSRKGNMQIHIDRWHGGIKRPQYIGEQTETMLKNHQPPSSIISDAVSCKSSPSPTLKSSKRPESVLEFIINTMHSQVIKAREMRRKIEDVKSFFNGYLSWFPQLSTNISAGHFALTNFGKPLVPHIPLPPFFVDTVSPSSTLVPPIDSQETIKEEIAGFTAKICDSCTEIVIEIHYGVHDSGKDPILITKNSHICYHPTKPSTLKSVAVRLVNFSAKLTEIPLELKRAVKGWTGEDVYLVAFKLPIDKVKGNIIDIYMSSMVGTDNNLSSHDIYASRHNTGTHRWALRAIENNQTILDDDDFTDFIRIANNKTSGFFRIHHDIQEKANIGNSYSCSGIYCMFINKGPLPNK
jgi:hypothetical protein